jgi:Z1 domain
MNKHLDNFLELRSRDAAASIPSIQSIAEKFVSDPQYLKGHTFNEPYTSILVGQVQSGKTGHYLGIAAAVADAEPRYPIFVLLTQSLVALQQQTYSEAKKLLTTFDVFDEGDELSFRHSLQYEKPKMIVLKKTKAPLKKWVQILTPQLLSGRPLFIIDDEADATGLNAMVNVPDQSEINRLIEQMVVENRSFLLQVTATPHAIFLQNQTSVFRPKSHLYFPPGADYLGGKFFYPSDGDRAGQAPYIFKPTADAELVSLQDPNVSSLPEGLENAIYTFILTAAYRIGFERDSRCNFLLHPSARTFDHNLIRDKVKRFVLDTLNSLNSEQLAPKFRACYEDLKSNKPQLPSLQDLLEEAQRTAFNVVAMNSSPGNLSRGLPVSGANIFIGGNVLGRGIVVPKLQTIYYCRSAQRLTIDTYWQHSRAFGYDRDAALVRLFMPPRLYSNFIQMSDSIMQLFESLETSHSSDVLVVTPRGMQPTRTAVVEDLASDCIVGGANHFPINPNQGNAPALDALLKDYDDRTEHYVIEAEVASTLLKATEDEELGGIERSIFEEALRNINLDGKVVLAVRRGREISANTGTLLSPDDRRLSSRYEKDAVLILYRLTGDRAKGWDGAPFWVPNVKLPGNRVIYFK